MKNKLLLLAMGIMLSAQTLVAQVPSYVSTNGLVGYWPFNGNANDVSTNANNGTNNGATLTTDRFGNANSAYSFSSTGNYIDFFSDGSWATNDHTISFWFKTAPNGLPQRVLTKRTSCLSGTTETHFLDINFNATENILQCGWGGLPSTDGATFFPISYVPNVWNNLIYVRNANNFYLYINGVLVGNQNGNCPSISCNLMLRAGGWSCPFSGRDFTGKFDDLGIWNRALTIDEITNLYNANQCITNITVTDTLIINVGQLSYNNPITYANNITIAPNPASTQININFNNITDLNGGSIKVINSLGQQVATAPITATGTQTSMQLATWGGAGMYFVQIINVQGQILDIKKIILQ